MLTEKVNVASITEDVLGAISGCAFVDVSKYASQLQVLLKAELRQGATLAHLSDVTHLSTSVLTSILDGDMEGLALSGLILAIRELAGDGVLDALDLGASASTLFLG